MVNQEGTAARWDSRGGCPRTMMSARPGLDTVRAVADQDRNSERVSFSLQEAAQHGRSDRGGVLLFDATHHHA